MSVTVIRCPRCHEEVAFGAVWCPHCGQDMTAMSPLEVDEPIVPGDTHAGWAETFEPLILGLGVGVALDLVDGGLFATSTKAGLGFWVAALFCVLFILSEYLIPAGPSIRNTYAVQPVALPGRSLWRHGKLWAPPSPFHTLLVFAPIIAALAVLIVLEGQVPV